MSSSSSRSAAQPSKAKGAWVVNKNSFGNKQAPKNGPGPGGQTTPVPWSRPTGMSTNRKTGEQLINPLGLLAFGSVGPTMLKQKRKIDASSSRRQAASTSSGIGDPPILPNGQPGQPPVLLNGQPMTAEEIAFHHQLEAQGIAYGQGGAPGLRSSGSQGSMNNAYVHGQQPHGPF